MARRRGWFGWAVLVAFIVVPLAEIYVLIQVGQVIGVWWTILLLVADSVLGTWLIRREGGRAWRALQTALSSGRMPARELADGALILVGGTLMLSPGFVTDAFGILPPIARLTRDQAIYWFLSGFTSKLAGTEIGVQEPQPTFSTCFGAPFLPQPPSVYAGLLGRKLDEHPDVRVWLVNTGWTGGPHGVGRRMPIQATRDLLHAALSGALEEVEYRLDEVFGLEVPVSVPGVDPSLLYPRGTWADPDAYDVKARELARMFRDNFTRFEDVSAGVSGAGPRV